jgi:hypothetical protein
VHSAPIANSSSSGRREDVLREGNGASQVARPTIVLDASFLLDKNLSIFR